MRASGMRSQWRSSQSLVTITLLVVLCCLFGWSIQGSSKVFPSPAPQSLAEPKLASDEDEFSPTLVVVVSVDQWAYEYFDRFRKKFSDQGIVARTQREGVWYRNCQHQHAFTLTAPGHSVLLTGTYPSRSGIVGNSWFDRTSGRSVYCVADPDANLVGDARDAKVSPRNLLVETVGDTLKLATRGQAKVFTVAIKDRASILMAGHLADAAFWLSSGGNWITSDHYRDDVPGYLNQVDYKRYGNQVWNLLLAANEYQHGAVEDSTAERPGSRMSKDFPHELPAADGSGYLSRLECSPFGNDLTLDAARQIVTYEKLGADDVPDILGINLSSTDYVGHAFGPESLEVEDMAYRTDLALGGFLDFLDEQVGKGRWVLFVAADHGVAPVPERAAALGLDAKRGALGRTGRNGDVVQLHQELEAYLRFQMGIDEDAPPLVQLIASGHLYFDQDNPQLTGEKLSTACVLARDWLLRHDEIAAAVTRSQLLAYEQSDTELPTLFRHSYHPQRSGDVLYAERPYHIPAGATATHGSPWLYDRHIPLMVIGHVAHADVERVVSPAQIAPTIARMLQVPAPSACEVDALPEVIGQ